MPVRLLLGKDTIDDGIAALGTEFILSDYESTKDAVATGITAYFRGSSGYLATIYQGDSLRDAEAELLSTVDMTSIGVGWRAVDLLSPIDVVNGKYYRLGGNGANSARTTTGTLSNIAYRIISLTYPNFVPTDPAGAMAPFPYRGYFGLLGWIPPEITSIDNGTLIPGQPRTIQGTDFMDSGDIATVWVADGPVFATATKVEQTLTAQSDDEITFDVVPSSLSGAAYLFVETELGQVNETGLQITLAHSGITLLTGVYGYGSQGLTTSRGYTSSPLVGVYGYSSQGLTTSRGYTSSPLVGAYEYSGATVGVTTARTEAPMTGVYGYSSQDLTTSRGYTSSPLIGVYGYSGLLLDFSPGLGLLVGAFRDKFPLFDSVSDAEVRTALGESETEVDSDTWGVWYELGLLYFAAWLLASQNAAEFGIGSGQIKSRTYGRSTVSFSAPQAAYFTGGYSTNWYGYRYEEIVEFHVGLHFVLAPNNSGRVVAGTDEDTLITPAQVRTKFPNFSHLSDDEIQPSIDEAALELWESSWGDKYELGMLYFTAYLLAESAPNASAPIGAVSMRKEGRVTVNFATPSYKSTGLHSHNWYGSRYDAMVENHIGAGGFVV